MVLLQSLPQPSRQRENPLIPYLSLIPEDEGSYPGAFSPFIAVDEGNTTPRFMRPTLRLVPSSHRVLQDTNIPFAIEVVPMACPEEGETLPHTVCDPSPPHQCKQCMAYMNCFVVFRRMGWVWRCNLCGFSNEVCSSYFSPLNGAGQRTDRSIRPELCHGTVEWLVPNKGCLVPPSEGSSGHHPSHQRAVVFCVDVSSAALQSGFTVTSLEAIKSMLSSMLESATCLNIGIVTFDEVSRVSFYYLHTKEGGGLEEEPERYMKVAIAVDVDQSPFSPITASQLLQSCKSEELDEIICGMSALFLKEKEKIKSHMGSIDALTLTCAGVTAVSCVADTLTECGGGHVVLLVGPVFTSVGPAGQTMCRSSPSLDGSRLKHLITNICVKHVGVDAIVTWRRPRFLEEGRSRFDNKMGFSRDAAAPAPLLPQTEAIRVLSHLTRGTGGRIYSLKWAVGISSTLKAIIEKCTLRMKGLKVAIKVRCSTGLMCTSIYGPGLTVAHDSSQRQLAVVDNDTTFVCELEHAASHVLKDNMKRRVMFVQVSVQFMTEDGLWKVRCHNMILHVTNSVERFYNAVDAPTMCIYMLRRNIFCTMDKTGGYGTPADMYSAFESMAECCVTIMAQYHKAQSRNITTSLNQPASLSLLPLLLLCIRKCIAFRSDWEPDSALALDRLIRLPLSQLLQELYPSLFVMKYSDITRDQEWEVDEKATTGMSSPVPLNILTRYPPSSQHIEWKGLSLILVPPLYAFLNVSDNLDEVVRSNLLGRAHLDSTGQNIHLKETGLEASRVRMWMKHCLSSLQSSMTSSSIVNSKLVKDDPFSLFFFDVVMYGSGDKSNEALFDSLLVESRTRQGPSYHEYMTEICNSIYTKLKRRIDLH